MPLTTRCVGTATSGVAAIYNGTTWSSSVVDAARGGLSNVSCVGTACVTVDGNGYAVNFTASSTSAPVSVVGGCERPGLGLVRIDDVL